MTEIQSHPSALTRRGFLGGTAAAIGISALPADARAQTTSGARYRRYEVSDPNMPSNILPSYKAAVSAMLELDPADPRNWYRNAMVHLLDCPHGNWWFLPWHRAYLGWLEQTCRDLSKDADFALPYWDWTKTPGVPAAMFDGVLDPNNAAFIPTSAQFQTDFQAAVSALYASFSQAQKDELAIRGMSSEAGFWDMALDAFVNQPGARSLTAANPNLPSFVLTPVSLTTIESALRVPLFSAPPTAAAGFGSDKVQAHSQRGRKGILESQPHDNVHGGVGGLMGDFLSSIDPIFFLHHGNIDRLWDVWTRGQQANNRPILPEGADLTAWSDEPFLFFSGPDGQPVAQTKAGDYAETALFDYDYSPGSGEPPILVAAALMAPAMRVAAEISAATTDAAAVGVVEVPAALLAAAAEPTAPPVVAEVTLNLDENDMRRRFRILVTPPGAAEPVEAGAITVFGHHEPGRYVFSVPLPAGLAGAGVTAAEELQLDISVEEVEPMARMETESKLTGETGGGAPLAAIELKSG